MSSGWQSEMIWLFYLQTDWSVCIMSTRAAKREARKQEILAAATAVFAQKGFDGASMDDIVQASGLSKGGLYWHFKSKDDIIAAILNEFFSQEMDFLDALLQAEGSATARLQQLGQQVMVDVAHMQELLPISLEFYALAARRETVREQLQDYFEQYRLTLATLIQVGIDAGEFDTAVAAEQAALNLIAQFEGLVLLWAIQAGNFDLEQQMTTAVTFFIKGLKTWQICIKKDNYFLLHMVYPAGFFAYLYGFIAWD